MKTNSETTPSRNGRRYVVCLPTPKVGDFLLLTPLLAAIRAHTPDAHIALMLRRPDPGAWITKHPLVDSVIWCNPDDKTKRRDLWRVARELRAGRFDVGIYRGISGHFAWMFWLAGIPVRVAGPYRHFRFLLTHTSQHTRESGDRHEVEYNLELLAPLAIPSGDANVRFPVSPEEKQYAARLLQQHGISENETLIALNAGHGGSSRAWPADRFGDVARQLVGQTGARILLIGQNNPADTAVAIPAEAAVGIVDLTGQTTLGQLAALLRLCRLHISVDTGTAHLAAAMRTGCVTLFPDEWGWKQRARWRPWRTEQRLLGPSVRCAGCLRACHRNGTECRLSITVEQVVAAANDLLADTSAGVDGSGANETAVI